MELENWFPFWSCWNDSLSFSFSFATSFFTILVLKFFLFLPLSSSYIGNYELPPLFSPIQMRDSVLIECFHLEAVFGYFCLFSLCLPFKLVSSYRGAHENIFILCILTTLYSTHQQFGHIIQYSLILLFFLFVLPLK